MFEQDYLADQARGTKTLLERGKGGSGCKRFFKGRKDRTWEFAACREEKELKTTVRKILSEPGAFSVSNTVPSTTQHPKAQESLIQCTT